MSGLNKTMNVMMDPIRSALFGGGDSAPSAAAAPAVTPPTPMPTPDDAAIKAAKRRSIADQQRRQGRASTILTDTGTTDALGG